MSERYSVSYTPEAYDDLGDIYSYIAFVLREKGTASRLVRRIRNPYQLLETRKLLVFNSFRAFLFRENNVSCPIRSIGSVRFFRRVGQVADQALACCR